MATSAYSLPVANLALPIVYISRVNQGSSTTDSGFRTTSKSGIQSAPKKEELPAVVLSTTGNEVLKQNFFSFLMPLLRVLLSFHQYFLGSYLNNFFEILSQLLFLGFTLFQIQKLSQREKEKKKWFCVLKVIDLQIIHSHLLIYGSKYFLLLI